MAKMQKRAVWSERLLGCAGHWLSSQGNTLISPVSAGVKGENCNSDLEKVLTECAALGNKFLCFSFP